MAKKYYGRVFTAETVKALKASDTLLCQVTEDGAIYVSTSFFAFRVQLPEYEMIVRPIAQRDPGNWCMRNGQYSEGCPDLKALIEKAVSDTPRENLLIPAPFHFDSGKADVQPFFCKAADFVIFFDSAVSGSFACQFFGTGPKSIAVAYDGDDPVGILLPIRFDKAKYISAVRAVFAEDEEPEEKTGAADLRALKKENRQLRADLAELQRRLNERAEQDPAAPQNAAIIAGLKKELADEKTRADSLADAAAVLREKLYAAEHAAPAPDAEKTDVRAEAEKLRAYWDAFDGIRAAIAGAKTSAPVVWLDGPAIGARKDEIRAAGGLYSGKRRAWYFSIR